MKKFDSVKTLAIFLICLGTLETILLLLAIKYEFSFSGGSIFYIYFGYKILKGDLTSYKYCKFTFHALLLLITVGFFSIVLTICQILVTPNFGFSLELSPLYILIIFPYLIIIPSLVLLINHPDTQNIFLNKLNKNTAKTLYLDKGKLILIQLGALLLSALLMAPHIFNNPYKLLVNNILTNESVKNDLGEVESTSLLAFGIHNWIIKCRIKVNGQINTGYYHVEIDQNKNVKFNVYDYDKPITSEDFYQYVEPEVLEKSSYSINENEDLLIETSFEKNQNEIKDISPLITTGKIDWSKDKRAHSGKFSVNAIPEGNPGILSYFNKSINSASLEPFNVGRYKMLKLNFWRNSTSNPSITHNCLGSLAVQYRLDNSDWKTKMVYCGKHKSKKSKWKFSELEFELNKNQKFELRFEYEYPPDMDIDKTVYYLVDDLQLIGILDDS